MSRAKLPSATNLKRAFVATVSMLAASTITAACGTTVQFPDGCPTAVPADGSDCDNDGQTCNGYRNNPDDGCPGPTARCVDGSWDVAPSGTCNPPPPLECPAAQPNDGSACSEAGQNCHYGPDECGLDVLATCINGEWDVPFNSCNPPPPTCPDDLPTDGEICIEQPGTWGGYPNGCAYPVDTPCGAATATGSCIDEGSTGEYRWEVELDKECDPQGSHCTAYADDKTCAADPACRFLVPASCPSPDGIPANGCYAAQDCTLGSCGADAVCTALQYDPCVNATCDACMGEANVCLGATTNNG